MAITAAQAVLFGVPGPWTILLGLSPIWAPSVFSAFNSDYIPYVNVGNAIANFFFPPDPAVYNVRINGICVENNEVRVTYSESGVSSNAATSYQWWRNGYPIPSAVYNSYRLTQADSGTTIFVVVCLTDSWGAYKGESPSVFIPNVNDLPTGTVTISGIIAENQLLTASNTIQDRDGMGPITYKWIRTTAYANSAYVGEIKITGTPRRDQVLTASSTVVDPDGMGPINYQWNRDGVQIVTGTSYTLGEADVGRYITVTASYTNRAGIVEYATSKATTMVKNFVEIAGTNRVYETLTATNTLTGVLGPITYTWRRNGVQIATGASYVLNWADEGTYITVSASYSKSVGIIESITTLPITRVQSTLYIEGTLVQGQVLTVKNLTDFANEVTYGWKRNGVLISGASGSSYTLVPADVGTYITVESTYSAGGRTIKMTSVATDIIAAPVAESPSAEIMGQVVPTTPHNLYYLTQADVGYYISLLATYTDAFGTVEYAKSVSTLQVVNVNNPVLGELTIIGTPAQYQVLTVSNTFTDVDGMGTVSYQWNLNGLPKSGAIGATYTLTQADVGYNISVTASYTDGFDAAESKTSAATIAVVHVNTLPTGEVTIAGTPAQYQVLTVSNTLADVDQLGPISYQWNLNGLPKSGATGTTYTLTQADVGVVFTVTASYTDLQGITESVTSAATTPVANVPDAVTGAVYIVGNAYQSQVLTAITTGLNVNQPGLSDVDGLGAFSYQWKRSNGNNFDNILLNATGRTYTLTEDDVGRGLKVTVSYTDGYAHFESVTSPVTQLVVNINDSPSGAVTISGNHEESQVLTVTNDLADIDGMGLVSYQWKRNGYPISGATGSTYALTKYEIGKRITVSAYYTDGHGSDEYITSDATAPVANKNDLLSGNVGISGTLAQYNAIFADTTELSDADGMGSITYQWNRNGFAIVGANNSSYWMTQDDVNQYITVTVYHRDLQGTIESKTSLVGVIPGNINDLPGGEVTISGLEKQNEWLTVTHNLNDLDGMVGGSASAITYQWKTVDYNGTNNIAGATGTSYKLTQGEVNKCIIVTASYTDSHGTAESKTSARTSAVVNVVDIPTGSVSIAGTAAYNQVLTATNNLSDTDGISSLYYEWKRNGVRISGATGTGPTYKLTMDDVGKQMTVIAYYFDGTGIEKNVPSAPTATVIFVNTPSSGAVTIDGTPIQNQALTANISAISDLDGISSFSYQWKRNGTDLSGQTGRFYVLGALDVGCTISVTVNITDTFGNVVSMTSAASAIVLSSPNTTSFNGVFISGTLQQGSTLTASNTLYDVDGIDWVKYKWQRSSGVVFAGTNTWSGSDYDFTDIVDATTGTYILVQADVGRKIRLVAIVLYTGWAEANAVEVWSDLSVPVANVNDLLTGAVSIAGTPTQKEWLYLSTTLNDADGSAIIYQWKRNGIDIPGATGSAGSSTASSYRLVQDDVGKQITVTAKSTDSYGNIEFRTTAPTAVIGDANDLPTGSVTIDGIFRENQVLNATLRNVSDLDGIASAFSYQWSRNYVDILGATGSTYTTSTADIGLPIIVTVKYTDLTGANESITSPSITITHVNTLPVGKVNIAGIHAMYEWLTASNTLTDADGKGGVFYKWKRNGTQIATGSTYKLVLADVGKQITVTASYWDGFATESVTSDPTNAVVYVNSPVAGDVNIYGIAEQDQVLTADTSGLSDIDGLGAFSYQWIRGTETILGATASTYTLTQTEVGKVIYVNVSYIDLQGTTESKTSAATATVVDANDLPTGDVTISGIALQGSTLTASNTLDDTDGMGTVSYRWYFNGVSKFGAVGPTYTLLEADVGKIVTVTASYIDATQVTASVTSAATVAVVNKNDPLDGRVSINGTAQQGVLLTANTSGISDLDGRGTYSYQWMRDGTVVGTVSGYTLTQADVGKQITLFVSYTDLHGTYESSTSLPTLVVANVNDSPTGVILYIAGTPNQNELLTATIIGTLSDADGLGQLSYQWMRNGSNIDLATNSTYTLVQADVGKAISVKISYTDGFNTLETITSTATPTITNTNDSPTGTVTISGFAAQYQILTATDSIFDADGKGMVSYRWKRNGVHIATGTSYTLTWADVGSTMTVTAVYTDLLGTYEGVGVTSDPTDTVVHVNTPVTGEVTISRTSPVTGEVTTTGTPKQNELLTAITSGLSDVDGLGSFSYQWKSDGVNILDATDSTYTLTQAMVGKTISVTVSYTDLHGNAWDIESKTSAATAPVVNVNDAPVGEVTISGILQTGQLLTASNYLQDLDGLGAISYQWKRGATVIATGSTYTLTLDDVGQYITVVASYTDLQLNPETASVTTNDVITTADNPVTGDITIHGLAKQRETLTYSSTLQDIDGIDSIEYIWIGPNDKELGRNTSYTLTQSDVGSTIKVYAVCKDMQGRTTLKQSYQTDIVENALDSPTGNVTIVGTPTQKQLLTANTNGISDLDGLTYIFTYQWTSGGVDVPGAIGVTYTLLEADVGKQITVTVKYTDGFSALETVTSDPTEPVANWNDPPNGTVTIAGLAQQGELLTATSIFSDDDGAGETITYTWIRDDTQIIATGSTYRLVQADVGYAIKVVASYTDGHETRESATSDATALVTNVNDVPSGLPTIGGIQKQGEILTVSHTFTDVDGLPTEFSYQWLRNGSDINLSATGSTYTLVQADVGKRISVKVSYKDGFLHDESITSAETDPIDDSNDLPGGDVTIAGTKKQGFTLTASHTLTDVDGAVGTVSYQWNRNGVAIAIGTTYQLVEADVDQTITVTATYSDGVYSNSKTSLATAPVENANDALNGSVSISGTKKQGELLTALLSDPFTDDDGLTPVSYQWKRNDVDISGATGSTYTLVQVDVGSAIKVVASYKDGHGTDESVTSDATVLIENVNDLPSGSVSISGTKKQGFTLTASLSDPFTDADGIATAFSYQWMRNGSDILLLATGSTYTLVQADVGKRISVKVSYTDGFSRTESVTSTETGLIANENDVPGGSLIITPLIPSQGQTLSIATNSIEDVDGLGPITWQWKSDGVAISGATGTTYVLTEAEVGKTITLTASYKDLQNTNESVTSNATAAVGNVNDSLVGHVMIDGDLTHGQTLTASHSFSDVDGFSTAVSYQWLKNGVLIGDAVGSTYTLTPADIGAKISVTASYTDGHGSQEQKTSADTYQIQPIRVGYSLQTKGIESVPPTPPVNGKVIIANTSELAITTSDNTVALSTMTTVEKQSFVKHNVSALLSKYTPSLGGDKLYVSKSLLPFAVTSSLTDTVELIDAKSSSVASPLVRVGDASAGAVYIDTVPGNSVTLTYSPDTVAITHTSESAFSVAINGAAAVNKLIGDKILLKNVVLTLGSITAAPNNLPVFVKNAPTTVFEDASYSYTVSVSDADNDTFTVTAPILPSWLTFSAGTLSCLSVPSSVVGSHAVQFLAEDIWSGKTYYDFTITVQNVPVTGTVTSSGSLKYSDLNTVQTPVLKAVHVSESDAAVVINTATVNGVDVRSYLQLGAGPSDYTVTVKSGQHAALLTLLRTNPGNVSIAIKITDISTPASPIYVIETITVLNNSPTTTQQFPSSMTIIEDSSTAYAQSGGTDSIITFSEACSVVLNGTYKDYFMLVATDGTSRTYKLKCKDLASARAIIPGTSYSLTVTATSSANALTVTSTSLSVQATNILTTAIVGGAKILTHASLQAYITSSAAIPNIATITLSESDPQSITLHMVTVNGSSVDKTYFTMSGSAGNYVLSVNTSAASQLLTRLSALISISSAYSMLMTFQVVEQGGNAFTQTITVAASNNIIKISLKSAVTNVPSMVSYSVTGSVATVAMNYSATPVIDYADYIISDANSAVGTRAVGGGIAYDGATLPTMYVGVSLVKSIVYQSPGEWIVTYYESYSGVSGSQSNTLTLKFSVRGAINFVLSTLNASYELSQALSIVGNYTAPDIFALPTITLSMPASQFNDGLFQLALTDSNINTLVNPATEAVYYSEKITYYANNAKFPLLKNSGNVLLKDLPVVNGAAVKPLRQRNAGADRLSDSMVHELAYQAIGVSLMNDQLANGVALTSSIDDYLTTALPAFVKLQLANCDGKTQNIAGASDLTTRANVSRELFMQIVESVVGGVTGTGAAKSSRLNSLFADSNFAGGKYGIKFIAGDTLRFSITISPFSVGGVVQDVDYIVDGVQHVKQEARTVELVITMV